VTEALLEVRGLSVRYGGVAALSRLDLDVGAGEIVGLIGPNGAGKTTCVDALTGFTAPSGGSIRHRGRPADGLSPHQRARAGFTRTFQSLELFDDLSVRENLAVGASVPGWRSTLTDALWRKPVAGSGVDEVIDLLDMGPWAERQPRELSNGQRHLVALGRGLVGRPSLLLLDEPAAGLDTVETAALATVLRSLPGWGTSVLLVDHDMALVFGVCDRVYVLDIGRCIAAGSPASVRADPAVVAAYLGPQEQTP